MSTRDAGVVGHVDPTDNEMLVDVRGVFDIDRGLPTTSWLNEVKIKYERAVCGGISPDTETCCLGTCHYIDHAHGRRVLVLICTVQTGSVGDAGGMEISWHPTTVYDDFVTQSLEFLASKGQHEDWWTRAKGRCRCIREEYICTIQQYPTDEQKEEEEEEEEREREEEEEEREKRRREGRDYEKVLSSLGKLQPCVDDAQSTTSSIERVFECQDVSNLVLRRVCQSKTAMRNIRLSCKMLCHAVDAWTVSTLVLDYRVLYAVRDTLVEDMRRRSRKWEMVRHVIFRAFSEDMFKEIFYLALEAWPRLVWIQFDGCDFSRDHLECTWDGLQNCRKIIMNNCLVCNQHLAHMVTLGQPVFAIQQCTWMHEEKPHFPDIRDCNGDSGLHTLVFTQNIVRPVNQETQRPMFEYFSQGFYHERLERLDLSGNMICPENLRILLHLGEFRKLKKLRLQDCGLHEAHAQMFLDCSAMPQLKHLDLSMNKLGTQVSLYYLSCSQQLTRQLEHLDISAQMYFHDDALAGFSFAIDPWISLQELNLEETQVNAIGMRGLLQASMPSLEGLSLYDAAISADALTVLSESHLLRNQLRILDVSGTNNGVEVRRVAACFPSETLEQCRLEILLLRHSGLTSARSKSSDRRALRQLQRCLPRTDIQIIPI